MRRLATLGLVLALAGCSSADEGTTSATTTTTATTRTPVTYRVRVVATHPHDDEAFTQGLVWAGEGQLFESTGRRGRSSLRLVDIDTGEVVRRHDLEPTYFGEGLARVGAELIQLTWQEHTAFRYDAETFAGTGTFSYETEGWGLCYDGARLVMSDGSAALAFRDPSTFAVDGTVDVTLDGAPLDDLNELECVDGVVYANVLGDDHVYEIDPATGVVIGVVDASELQPDANRGRGDVLNGIAHDPTTGRFYLTGKDWPTLYEVEFEPTA